MNETKIPYYLVIAAICVFVLGRIDLSHTVFDININSGFYILGLLFSEFYSIVLLAIAAVLWFVNRSNLVVGKLYKNVHFFVTVGLIFFIVLTNLYLKLTDISDGDNLTRYAIFYSLLILTLLVQPVYLKF